ncbi:Xaa-Pro dipeptidase [Litorimonas taeanensis]|uniref:Xaa-Pro dipeptidase n=1 Tax=Litorimonas taeanensis TaxID=568099 RepID=A0A420WKU6_9PROT|nr:Xaa-Pro peptidase family protein [Litorimonas taeanensis]RKQ71515.1 Xaa-Pro dipeptidase [Litorimonas taeanensis]
MTLGVGGKTAEQALATLSDMTEGVTSISYDEYAARIVKAQRLMNEQGLEALYLHAGTSLYYFTGTHWHGSERMVGAILLQQGPPIYIAPAFEEGTLNQFMTIKGEVLTWDEHESPYTLISQHLATMGINKGVIGIDEATPFFVSDGIAKASQAFSFTNGASVTASCRMIKSPAELALMKRAKEMTLAVHKATASMLRLGISTEEVGDFIDAAHRKVGAPKGSYFKIVLFGQDTSFPHGVKSPKSLEAGDMVLIDTGCQLHDYISDITRTYVFGTPTAKQRQVWEAEKAAQAKAFEAAQIGKRCGDVDLAARKELEKRGFGPGYKTPGLPHRTGHGIGLDIHEWPYLNWGDNTILEEGMCFSNEPMICLYGEFGVRLEDHFYMDKQGPVWFTKPSRSIDAPFD